MKRKRRKQHQKKKEDAEGGKEEEEDDLTSYITSDYILKYKIYERNISTHKRDVCLRIILL